MVASPTPTDVSMKPKILVVEDEPDLNKLYQELLLGEGYDVQSATDGKQALDILEQGGFDLVLLDIMLPSLDGLQILERLKDTPPAKPNKRIVLLTNLNQDEVIAQAVQLDVYGYIIKSDYTPEQFLEIIKKMLKPPES